MDTLQSVHTVRTGRREFRWRVILAIDVLQACTRRQVVDLRFEVSVVTRKTVVLAIFENDRVALAAGSAPAVVEVEVRQVLEHFVQRLLLILVALA